VEKTIDATLAVLRKKDSPDAKWRALIEMWSRLHPSPVWAKLEADLANDINAAETWLRGHLRESPSRGLYLGLDTLNMNGGAGMNVEIAGTRECDPMAPTTDWAFECEWSGEPHLIRGLVAMKQHYEKSNVSPQADYLVFLGYSGLVFGEAIVRLKPAEPILVVWGFHDGDLFRLARATPDGSKPLYAE
jgi:hypothetical protein